MKLREAIEQAIKVAAALRADTEAAELSPLPQALTPERWAEAAVRDILTPKDRAESVDVAIFARNPHEHAALLLFGQPFGFTHEMVDALEEIFKQGVDRYNDEEERKYQLGAAAIANLRALLPPREP